MSKLSLNILDELKSPLIKPDKCLTALLSADILPYPGGSERKTCAKTCGKNPQRSAANVPRSGLFQPVAQILVAQVAVVGDREAVGFVAEARAHEQRLGVARKEQVLASVVEDKLLLPLREADRRDVVDAELR